MQLIIAIMLGLVQGITEFIPVSSSGHLILIGHWLHFQYSGLAFDTALDVGTLLALGLFFAKDFARIAHDMVMGGSKRRLGWLLVAATIPGVAVGVLVEKYAETIFRSDFLVAANLVWVGVLMWVVDKWSDSKFNLDDINLPRALTVGVAQALALIPGVSRSGITISAGRMIGIDRVSATKFSFLLSAPIIAGATLKILVSSSGFQAMSAAPVYYLAGILSAFISGYLSIKFLLKFLARHGLAVFAGYRVIVGAVIIILMGLNNVI